MSDVIKTDTLTGVDRYKHSDTFGQQIVEAVFLWIEPGKLALAPNLSGALAHGTEVCVMGERRQSGDLWAFVEAEQGGQLQAGWCKAVFLEEMGKPEMERLNNGK